MAIKHGLVNIGTTATLLVETSVGRDGQTVLIQNPANGVNVFIGGEGVTASSYGAICASGASFSIDLKNGETLYAVVATGSQTVSVMRQGA
jgi:hypothetical protein